MSPEAITYLDTIKQLYAAAGSPNPQQWYFDAGKSEAVHHDLVSCGLLAKVLGTEHGFGWRLTPAGAVLIQARVSNAG